MTISMSMTYREWAGMAIYCAETNAWTFWATWFLSLSGSCTKSMLREISFGFHNFFLCSICSWDYSLFVATMKSPVLSKLWSHTTSWLLYITAMKCMMEDCAHHNIFQVQTTIVELQIKASFIKKQSWYKPARHCQYLFIHYNLRSEPRISSINKYFHPVFYSTYDIKQLEPAVLQYVLVHCRYYSRAR